MPGSRALNCLGMRCEGFDEGAAPGQTANKVLRESERTAVQTFFSFVTVRIHDNFSSWGTLEALR